MKTKKKYLSFLICGIIVNIMTTAQQRADAALNKWYDKQLKIHPLMKLAARREIGRLYCKQPRSISPWITYFIQGEVTKLIKIGKAKDIDRRLKNLQCGSPDNLVILKSYRGDAEKTLHKVFSSIRLHGEWFFPHPDLLEFISGLL